MLIGKIVKSVSHISFICQIFGRFDVEEEPNPADFGFGRFVRVALHSGRSEELLRRLNSAHKIDPVPPAYVVCVIYDTILLNPDFGSSRPRLSNEKQVELFSPDYIAEKGSAGASFSSRPE